MWGSLGGELGRCFYMNHSRKIWLILSRVKAMDDSVFAQEGTVLFVNKKNQKNFRAHPCGMLWPCLPGRLGWIFRCGALIMGENLTRATPENHSPTKQGGENTWSAHRDDLCKSLLGTFSSEKVRFHAGRYGIIKG